LRFDFAVEGRGWKYLILRLKEGVGSTRAGKIWRGCGGAERCAASGTGTDSILNLPVTQLLMHRLTNAVIVDITALAAAAAALT
jgi:hypothetical protein